MLDKIEAFAEAHSLFPSEGLILAAVSGGADSVCLLEALRCLTGKLGFSVAAIHYNHQLRGAESDRDAQFVENLCMHKNIPLYTGTGNVAAYARDNGFGIEEAARRLRYGFFYETADKLKAKRIATAHTADDNVETMLLNLTRGTGTNGLGGIPPVRGTVIRPMLEVSRLEVLDFLRAQSQPYMEDSTNALDNCSRNLVRHRVVPVLKELNPRLTDSVSSAASLLREDEVFLSTLAEQFIAEHVTSDAIQKNHACTDSTDISKLTALAAPIAHRVIRRLAGRAATARHVASVMALCASADVSGEISLPGCTVYREYTRIVFSHGKLAESFSPVELDISGNASGSQTLIPELGLMVTCRIVKYDEKINKSFNTFLFKYDNIYDKIVIRPRVTSDKIDLFGRSGTKTLKKLFIENHIPVRKRHLIPVVADGSGVLGVYGLGFDKRAACQPGDAVLEIIFEETAYET